ncbi:MAG: TolC family protein [Limnochordia bacterium]|jgi:outer membrane protein TolC
MFWLGKRRFFPQVVVMSIGFALVFSSCCAGAEANTRLAGNSRLDQVSVPLALLEVINKTLSGPQHEKAAIVYAGAASTCRAALAALQPQIRASIHSRAASPFGDKIDAGVMAGPSITWSIPTGQGHTDISLGAAVRTGYAQPVGAQASLSVQVPLLSGPDGRHKIATQGLSEAQDAYLADQRKLIIRAMQVYDQLIQAEQGLLLASRLLQLTEEQYSVALEREQRGTVSAAELYQLRSSLAASLDAEAEARRRVAESRDALRELTGQDTLGLNSDSTEQVLLHADLPEVAATPEAWVAIALSQRSDMHSAHRAVSLAKEALVRAQLQAKREISFTAGATWPHKVTETSTDLRTQIQAGVQATFFLSDGVRAEEVVSAQLSLEQANRALRELECAIDRAVHGVLYDIAESERSLRQAYEQLEQDTLLLTVVQERLERGLGLQHDVAAKELAVAQQTNRIRALEARLTRQCVTLWHTVGSDPLELSLSAPWVAEDHCPACRNTRM